MIVNLADIIVIGLIGLGIWLGAVKGLIKMVLSLCSWLVAVIVAFFIQPIVLVVLKEYTSLFDTMVHLINRNINLGDMAEKLVQPSLDLGPGEIGYSPQILALISKKIGIGSVLESSQIQINHHLAELSLEIISFFAGFIIALLVFLVIGWALSGAGKLPVIKEVNKFAGAMVGGLMAVLLIWIGMLFLNYWFSTGQKMDILVLICQSLFAKYLYQYNFLVYYLLLIQ